MTAYYALFELAHPRPGQVVLVHSAAGGVGGSLVQLLKIIGCEVVGVVGSSHKVDAARAFGADHVIEYRSQDIAEGVREVTEGRGADAIYDPVGGEAFESAKQCIAHEGRILAIGFASGSWGQSDTSHLVYNNYSVVGVIPSQYDRAFKEAAQERLLGWWREGALRPQIDIRSSVWVPVGV